MEKEDRCCSHSRNACAGTPKGTLPPGLTTLQKTEDHTAQETVAHGGGGAGGGPSGLSVDERGEGLSREFF